ncbi:MAG: nicotinate-nucleotide adenylyltransferase [Flavobacteriales bacterium]|jgi:nicotinate-nucleotide adenylyltransferase|nr:nicotinate-nucleotide adenylyltransferase [Flavobacteriales bacterium]MBK9513980.1 nicotinate-nucleotide adenylyltransferase [Flavobacteriales bacterium]
MMRVGCLFGTFDPPHAGHLAVANHMLKHMGLDQVWLVVTPLNPFKQGRTISPDTHRLAMVRLAVQGHEGVVASGFEIDLPKPSYTADSLRFMRHRWPDHSFDLIIGSDNLASFHQWKDPEDILEHHRLLVYPRHGMKEHLASSIFVGHPHVRVVANAPLVEVSATRIRSDIANWRAVDAWVDPQVLSHIRQNGLYKP